LKKDGSKHEITDDGQANGIKPDDCAKRIITAIEKNKRKIYIVKQERVLLFFNRFIPSIFVLLVKKLKLS
jgi:short-subunit dehydrogenase